MARQSDERSLLVQDKPSLPDRGVDRGIGNDRGVSKPGQIACREAQIALKNLGSVFAE